MDSGETNNLKRENFAWLDKLRYEKSFTAKLLLADQSVKDYYALIVGEILSYDKTRARNGWGGVAFTAGKKQKRQRKTEKTSKSVAFLGL